MIAQHSREATNIKPRKNPAEAVLVTDSKGVIQSVSNTFTAITGYNSKTTIGKNLKLLYSSRYKEKFHKRIWASLIINGYWQGEIWTQPLKGDSFPARLTIDSLLNKNGQTSQYIAVLSCVSGQKNNGIINFQSTHDALTGLPNRKLFNERFLLAMDSALRRGKKMACVYLDLDRFKQINFSVGQAAGDKLLQTVAERLKYCMRNVDLVSRIYSDEFAILVPDIKKRDTLTQIAKRILSAFRSPLLCEGYEFFITVSIGIVICPDNGKELDILMKNVTSALDRAKQLGGNNFQFCKLEKTGEYFEKLMLENRLRVALDQHELTLHYQPLIDLSTGKTVCVEALLRWTCPGLGSVSPGEFIPVAEETGLIVPIGAWVLLEACKQNQKFQKLGFPPFKVAVNLSALQFLHEDMLETVTKILKDTGLSPSLLELELTESTVMSNAEESIKTLTKIKSMGVTISIDDFGTGYSSLSYLKRFPLDTLKIDRSFIQEITSNKDDAAIVKATIVMAHTLGLKVVAEGVEKKEQVAFLREFKCDIIQGYYFSRPLPKESITEFLMKSQTGNRLL